MTTIKARLDRLESQAMPASAVALDLAALSADDRAFIAEIGPRCEAGDYSAMSVADLERLCGIAEAVQ